jgi:DNA-binding response OmpR family regulator
MVSARGSDVDKVAALHLGADDYVTKPFSPSELIARIETVLRRAGRTESAAPVTALTVADLTVDAVGRVASHAGRQLVLTPKEFDLLAVLCRLQGVALAREKLLDLVWGSNFYGVRTVDLHVARLRKKLAGSRVTIETVWGSGYRLTAEGGPANG